MKEVLLTLGVILGLLQSALAGGNSSIVEFSKVTSIEIEDGKVIIKGEGMLRKRMMSDAKHGDATAFGQPAQMIHVRTRDGVFELVPYLTRSDIAGVPGGLGGEEVSEAQAAISKEHWAGLIATAKKIKTGDAVTIGYQREKMTIKGLRVTHVVGAGSLRIEKSVGE